MRSQSQSQSRRGGATATTHAPTTLKHKHPMARSKRLALPSLLVSGTHASSSGGAISRLRLRSTATSKQSLPVQLRGDEGGQAFLSLPLVLSWTTESGIGSTLPIRLCNIASISCDDNTISLKFKGIGTGSSIFTIKFRLESERVATTFVNGIESLVEWNRIHEKGLLEYHKIDALSARPSNSSNDVIRLGLRSAKVGDDAAFMQALCQGYPIDALGGPGETGDTALLLACRHGHRGIVALCLSKNALLDPLNSSQTAIHAAVKRGNVELVRTLLDHAESRDGQAFVEALLNCMDDSSGGETALHHAVSIGNLSMVRLCIERGANVSAMVGSTGQTAVHVAAQAGDPMILSVLLEASDPSLLSVADLRGRTPLMIAVAAGRHGRNDSSFRRKSIRCMLDLLSASSLADESFDGSGALQIARQEGMSGIASIIKDGVRHLRAVKEQADVLNLTGLARNQYRAEQCLRLQKREIQGCSTPNDVFTENAGGLTESAGGLREGAPTPLSLPPSSSYSSSSSVGPPVLSGGKSAALTTGNLGVETKERAAIKDQPATKLSSNVPANVVGDNTGTPGPSDTATNVAEEKASNDVSSSATVDTGEPLKDKKEYARYFKMMKMMVPIPAIKHKMVQENVDPAILDLDPEKSYESQEHLLKKSGEQTKKKPLEPKVITGQKTTVTTTPLHWDALPENVASYPGSFWNSDTNPFVSPEALKMIEENFEVKSKSMVVVSQAIPADNGQMILSTKWANNTSITMKPFSMAGVANMYDVVHLVSSLSSGPVVTLERAESLLTLLQTIDRTEVKAIREFSGDPADLCTPDRFIHITMKEKNRFLKKLEMFCFVQRFDEGIDDLRETANKMLAACVEICDNEAIGRLLLSLLSVGNIMNENSKARSGRAVQAVHLDTLFKAALKKGKSASTMDVAIINLLGWNGDEVHPIVPTLECVKIAERIDLEYILQELEVLQKGIKRLTKELTIEKQRSSDGGESGDMFIPNASNFLENAQPLMEETRAAVHPVKEKVSAVFSSLGLPQSGEKAMKTDELFATTLKLAAAADASMAKCRKNGRGKKMEDEDIQKLQQQHQKQRQRKEQSNSNIDRDQSRPPDTAMANPQRRERQQSRKVEIQHAGQKEVAVLKRHGNGSTSGSIVMVADTNTENIQENPVLLTSLSVGSTKKPPLADDENEGVADEKPLQAPAAAPTVATVHVVDTAPADPRAALLGAIKSRHRDGDECNSEDHAPANPRMAMLSAIRSRRPDKSDEIVLAVVGTTEESPVADDENEGVADEEPLQAPAAAPTVATVHVVDTAPADPRAALLGAIRSRRRDDEGNSEDHAPADPRAALLGAIRSRDIVGGVDPRKAMLSAIEAQRKD